MASIVRKSSQKPRLVVLGSGWGAFSFLKNIDVKKFDISVVSPRDHMLFTPLLASTTVGTLEHRSVIEPLRPLASAKRFTFYQGEATAVDPNTKQVVVRKAAFDSLKTKDRKLDLLGMEDEFKMKYDGLVVGVGAVPSTFGIPGVEENTFFLKEARDGQRIRRRIHDCFEAASYPVPKDNPKSVETRKALLTFCVVGGGPTGCEFAAELSDFINQDATRAYPDSFSGGTDFWPRVVLLEASQELLGAFDTSLRGYALKKLHKAGNNEVRLGAAVERVEPGIIYLKGGETIRCGLIVWSTGVGPRKFITEGMEWAQKQGGRLQTNPALLLTDPKADDSIFAIGDCATVEDTPLPAIAQVAEQQGTFLAKQLNENGLSQYREKTSSKEFHFKTKGMLAYLGNYSAVASLATPDADGQSSLKMKGPVAWLLWRGAYLSKLGSWRNRLQVPVDWFKALVFGRDSSKV